MSKKSFTFNWHDEETTSEFLRYVWVCLMAGGDRADLMERTDRGQAITLQVFANGAEVDARALMKSLEANFDMNVKKRAGELARSIQLEELMDTVVKIERQLKTELENRFKAIGIAPISDEDY